MRLIDVDALIVVLEKIPAVGFKNIDNQTYTLVLLAQVLNIIKQQSTIERKTGFWFALEKGDKGYSAGDFKCSVCGEPNHTWIPKPRYCPMCGARMGEQE